jgi:hypothetical protein
MRLASHPMSTEASFPEMNRPGHEDMHSLPSSAEVKNGGAIPPPSVRLHGGLLN